MSSSEVLALFSLADKNFQAGHYEKAWKIYSDLVERMPNNVRAIEGVAYCAANLGNHEAAFALLKEANSGAGGSIQGLYYLGAYYLERGNYDEAIACFKQSLHIAGDYFEALHDLGAAYAGQGDIISAYEAYQSALAFNDQSIDIYLNLGDLAMMLQRIGEAERYYLKAAELDQESAYPWAGYGAALARQGRYQEALPVLDKALECDPELLDVYIHRGDIFNLLKRHELAVKSYQKAEAVFPETPFILGKILHQKMLVCDWSDYEKILGQVRLGIAKGQKVAEPFGFQAISDSEDELKICAKLFSDFYFQPKTPINSGHHNQGPKIKIGYVCGEFRNQATSMLMAGVYEAHNKCEFEIFAFDNGLSDGSTLRMRIESAFDQMIDIRGLSDYEAATLIAENEIDILVNLNGYFGASRQGIFASRPAPIQVNYLGFPGTLGSEYIDYLIADDVVIPPSSYQYYYEKIVSLPNCYQANDDKRKVSDKEFKRADFGLPVGVFVYCCFNNNYKITPEIFKLWMSILSNTSKTVLWLLRDSDLAAENLLSQAGLCGVSRDRIFFADRCDPQDHLARHRLADLFLDTFPYNAHTTASDAIWAGLPILTYVGKTFPGRVTSSLLMELGVTELIASSQEDYQKMAIHFANYPQDLLLIRNKIGNKKHNSYLFNTAHFTKTLEDAYKLMYSRNADKLLPEHLRIL